MQSSQQWTTFLDGVVLEASCEGGWSFDALFIRAPYALGGSGIDCYYGYTGGEILSLCSVSLGGLWFRTLFAYSDASHASCPIMERSVLGEYTYNTDGLGG